MRRGETSKHSKSHAKPRARKTGLSKAAASPPTGAAFATDQEMLQAAADLFKVRQRLTQGNFWNWPDERLCQVRHKEKTNTSHWHRAFSSAKATAKICKLCIRKRLNRCEREILAVLLLNRLSLSNQNIDTSADVINAIGAPGNNLVGAVQLLSDKGRLYKSGLVTYYNSEEELPNRRPEVASYLADLLIATDQPCYLASSEMELYDRLQNLTHALSNKSDQLEHGHLWPSRRDDALKWNRISDRFLRRLDQTLQQNKRWKLNALRKEVDNDDAWIMVLALLGKELGHLDGNKSLFTGAGLSRAASSEPFEAVSKLRLLSARGALISRGLVQPCNGTDSLVSENPTDLGQMEYELTHDVVESLGLSKKALGRSRHDVSVRDPVMRMDQLVLADNVREALHLVEIHAQNSSRLLDAWGMGEMISYGRGPVMLFSGPPGTGKTAAAEALAHQIKKPILVADYSRIQNCYVGQTEKNIVRVFGEAKRHGAVLFWDEADAMFFDRDASTRTWEVRDVNVLLQQTERFEGVCILATNRKATLDKALERRITLKVEFERLRFRSAVAPFSQFSLTLITLFFQGFVQAV